MSPEERNEGRIKFAADRGFHAELKRRVQRYFDSTGLSPRDSLRMYLKTAAILMWFAASYALLVFVATTWWEAALFAISLALSVAGIGFSIQHDANHGAYSDRKIVNRLMGTSLDFLGASSGVWRWKHNVFHHTYTNLDGADDDINIGPLGRLAPVQRRYRIHRFQHFYMWLFYGFLLVKWHFYDDFKNVIEARIAGNRFPRPRGLALLGMVGGKGLFIGWAFVLPLFFHPWWVVLLFYGCASFVVGITLSVIFQMAHCIEEADFPAAATSSGARLLPSTWAEHQVQTTVNFARRSRLLTWYLGGLNFQIEHHLFPSICHVHYPRISEIVQSVCRDFDVRYAAHDRLLPALSSHWRWLRQMGRPISAERRVS